jgi:hypothetical protein
MLECRACIIGSDGHCLDAIEPCGIAIGASSRLAATALAHGELLLRVNPIELLGFSLMP